MKRLTGDTKKSAAARASGSAFHSMLSKSTVRDTQPMRLCGVSGPVRDESVAVRQNSQCSHRLAEPPVLTIRRWAATAGHWPNTARRGTARALAAWADFGFIPLQVWRARG